ncbi:unnamed protein product [Rotaria sp. Silwood1]|nr:unnamed protein product [Rotaria sp. Silwood1]CAF1346768.1 unnamed protein product [Rotaria sp. Silwood1]
MINIIIKRSLIRYYSISNIISKRYLSSDSSDIFKLQERGFFCDNLAETDDNLRKLISTKKQTIYCGFDPTAKSLHIGNLVGLIGLLHWQRAGHQPIALLGSATVLIGDPSGRLHERKQSLTNEDIVLNTENIERLIRLIFQNHEKYFWKDQQKKLLPLTIVNNLSFYENMNTITFVSTYGPHFRMNQLLSRKVIKTRIETSHDGLGYNEFSYQLYQAYDWYCLFKQYGCRFQLGGVDQIGNMRTGHDFISRMTNFEEDSYGVTVPLITNESGEKLGKSVGNALWLDENLSTPYECYQHFRNTSDTKVEEYLKIFTFLSLNEIQQLMEIHRTKPHEYAAQIKLAKQITLLVHGEKGLESAIRSTQAMFAQNIDLLHNLTEKEIDGLSVSVPTIQMSLNPELTLLDVCMAAKCFSNKLVALKVINDGGVYVNHKKLANPHAVLVFGIHILPNKITVLRVGKKNYYMIRWTHMDISLRQEV